jgi:hypothetical protein
VFDRIEFEVQNNSFYFDPENPLHRSSDSNISTAILAASYIVSKKDGDLLIGVDNVFLTEALHQITRGLVPGSPNKNPFKIGRLAKERTKYTDIKNYPENTDLVVQYVYTNPMPTNWGSDSGLTDPRSVNVSIQHSFIQMPENNYQPRYDDPRGVLGLGRAWDHREMSYLLPVLKSIQREDRRTVAGNCFQASE